MDKVLQQVIDEVSEKYGLDKHTAELVYLNMFKFIRGKIEAIDFSKLQTEEDLRKAKVNFNIPRIFKLYTTLDRMYYAREAIRKNHTKHDQGVNVGDNLEETSSIDLDTSGSI